MRRRHVLVLQLDGSIPNLALLRIAGHHRRAGDAVEYRVATGPRSVERGLYDVPYHRVYASLIFEKTRPLAERLKSVYPNAAIGGTGWDYTTTLASAGVPEGERPDPYPMPFVRNRETLGFQRWVLRRVDKAGVSWEEFRRLGFDTRKRGESGPSLFDEEV